MTTSQWQMAESLFHTALELAQTDRAEWLKQTCPDDPVIRSTVLEMLEADALPGDDIRQAVRFAVREWIAR